MNTWSGRRQGQVCYPENGPEGDEIGGEAVTRCSCQVVHLGVQAHARENVPGTHPQSQGYRAGVPAFPPQPSGLRLARWPLRGCSRGEPCRGGGSAGPQGSPRPAASPLCPPPSPQLPPPLRKLDCLRAAELQPARLGLRARAGGRAERQSEEAGRKGPPGAVRASAGSRPAALGRGRGSAHAPPLAPPRPPRGARPSRRRTYQSLGTKPAP